MKREKNQCRQDKYNQNGHGKAALFTLGFCYIFLIIEIGYKIKIERQICTWEIALIFLMLSMYGIFQKLFSKSEVPTNLRGEPLPTGKDKKDKNYRKRFYALNALVYSVLIALAIIIMFVTSSDLSNVKVGTDTLFENDMSNFAFGLILAGCLFPIAFVISFMVEYVWYEYKISQYNLLVLIRAEADEEKPSEDLHIPDDYTKEFSLESSTENSEN